MTLQPAVQASRLEVHRVTPAIGGEVRGLDLSQPLDDATFTALHEALMERQVVFFRDQHITLEQQVALGKRFGLLHVHPAAPSLPGHPEIFVIHADEKSKNVAGNFWHSDVSCEEEPPMGTILHLHQVPSSGGDTLFASMTAAYEDLSDSMQHFLDGMTAVHESEHIYRGRYADRGGNDATARYPIAEHPVVRIHPVTGRKGLYVNEVFTTRIKGLKPAESKALLEMLFSHCRKSEFQVRFK